MPDSYKVVNTADGKVVEITSTLVRTVRVEELERERNDLQREIAALQARLAEIENMLSAVQHDGIGGTQ